MNASHRNLHIEVAEKVIVQVNENMPRTHGNTFINVSEVYKIIEHTAPLQELDCPAPTDEEKELLHLFRHSLMMNLLATWYWWNTKCRACFA